ncbi:TPA: hypothetical protein ACF9J1_001837, partial [Staphylococcus aureus]
ILIYVNINKAVPIFNQLNLNLFIRRSSFQMFVLNCIASLFILFLSIKRIKYLLDKEENRHKVEINKIKTNIFKNIK